MQALAAFDVRRQEVVGKELNKLKEGTNLLNELLNSMNLPAALGRSSNLLCRVQYYIRYSYAPTVST
jgi:hypothetical protein